MYPLYQHDGAVLRGLLVPVVVVVVVLFVCFFAGTDMHVAPGVMDGSLIAGLCR